MPATAIQLNQLTKSFGAVQALRGVDLQVRSGEIVGFLGPNGAGKTTAIRCMLDLLRPSSGEVRVLGMDPRRRSKEIRKRVGYLPGELHFDDNQTAYGALELFRALRGRGTPWSRIRDMANRLELDLSRPIKTYSKGNKQKVGVIQALMHQPELLLLDEPTSGLDPLMQHQALSLIREARQQGATVFFSSHALSEVQLLADRVAIIRGGEVAEVMNTEGLIQRSLRRVSVRFKDPTPLTVLPELSCVTRREQTASSQWKLETQGDVAALIVALAQLPLADLEMERPSLEEVFLGYYDRQPSKGTAS
jgi:ABC-2 type transport system ATP-binding protein